MSNVDKSQVGLVKQNRVSKLYPSVQVVFSVADLKSQFQAGDEVWMPSFTFDDNPRFFGSIDQNQEMPSSEFDLTISQQSKTR